MSKDFVYRWQAAIGGRSQGIYSTKQAAEESLDAIERGEVGVVGNPIGRMRSCQSFRVYYRPCVECGAKCLPVWDGACDACYIRVYGRSSSPLLSGALVFWRITETDIMDNGLFPEYRPRPVYFSGIAAAESHYEHVVEITGREGEHLRRFHYRLEKVELPQSPDTLALLNGRPKIVQKCCLKSTHDVESKS